ncbi:hypothetical protein HPY31_25705 [Brevibacillus sp. HB1.3]|nr:hypothetical protein [Brevibacillus sp. HB1.3]NQF17274.1 hypothetical protein [Brevibacillus sp. HB1.3]
MDNWCNIHLIIQYNLEAVSGYACVMGAVGGVQNARCNVTLLQETSC